MPRPSTPHAERASKGAAAKARAKARKNNSTPDKSKKDERPMTGPKSYIVTDEEFKARVAAMNRENPRRETAKRVADKYIGRDGGTAERC